MAVGVVVVMGGGIFQLSRNHSDTDTTVLKRTIQETSLDGPDGISRAVHAGITC